VRERLVSGFNLILNIKTCVARVHSEMSLIAVLCLLYQLGGCTTPASCGGGEFCGDSSSILANQQEPYDFSLVICAVFSAVVTAYLYFCASVGVTVTTFLFSIPVTTNFVMWVLLPALCR
jgi:hypothetical protein